MYDVDQYDADDVNEFTDEVRDGDDNEDDMESNSDVMLDLETEEDEG